MVYIRVGAQIIQKDERKENMMGRDNKGIMLSLQVGGHAVDDEVSSHPTSQLDEWLAKLEKTIPDTSTQTSQHHSHALSATPPPLNFERMSRLWFLHLRDQAQKQLEQSLFHYRDQIAPQATVTTSEPLLLPDEFQDTIKTLESQDLSLEKYYELQNNLSTLIKSSEELKKQWLNLPQSSSELPQIRSVLEKLFDTYRQAHRQWLDLSRQTTEALWQLRVDLVEAYVLLVRDVLQNFVQEANRVHQIFSQVQNELIRQIQVAESSSPFFYDFRRLQNNCRFWLHSVRDLLPASLQYQQHVLESTEANGESWSTETDPCCLKRITALTDQLQRVESTLKLQPDSPPSFQNETLTKELEMATTEWQQTQNQLSTVEHQLQNLSRQRILLWSKEQSVSELEQLERKQLELEQKQSSLLGQIGPLRQAVEKLRNASSQVTQQVQVKSALHQCQEWLTRVQEFKSKCEQESAMWSEGRGLQYRAKMTVQEETWRTIQSLYLTAQQKMDGAGLALLRYGLLLWQNLWTGAAVQHHSLASKQSTTQHSLDHYIQRLALAQPSLAELLNQQWQMEQKITLMLNELEEMQLSHNVKQRLKKALTLRV